MSEDRRLQEEFNSLIVERIRSDPDFLGHLLDNAEVALEQAGLAEAAHATQERQQDDEDVAGHRGGPVTYYWTCGWRRYPYKYHCR